MSEKPIPDGPMPHPRACWLLRPNPVACALGFLSLALFFLPIVTPFLQLATLLQVFRAAWRGELNRLGVIAGAGGAALGLLLFLALELLWIV